MKGGQRIVPLYKEPQNSPFVPNMQKQIFGDRMAETMPRSTQGGQGQGQGQSQGPGLNPKLNPIVNLQVYQPPKPRDPPRSNNAISMFQPTAVPTPFFPPQYGYQVPPYMANFQKPGIPIIANTYNISIDGVTGNPDKIGFIYEDMMPSRQFSGTTTSIGERLNIYNFVKAMMFSMGDGKNISLDGNTDGIDSILSHLKFMDLNPYNTYRFSANPYKGLPSNFLIYRSCYPIRHDSSSSTVVCARDSLGTNIRIYKMTEGSYLVNSQHSKNYYEYDEWREISYYEYVREYIIRKKQCPNFVFIYGYYISENSRIDFDKISSLRGKEYSKQSKYIREPPRVPQASTNQNSLGQPQFIQEGGDIFEDKDIFMNTRNINGSTIQSGIQGSTGVSRNSDNCISGNTVKICDEQIALDPCSVTLQLNPDAYLGKALVVMTEAPTYNIFGWASKTYQSDGNVRRQINTGFHLDKVWYGVLFQLMAAMYCMQINKIYFTDFTVEDNIYIKDVGAYGAATRYWKYKIDGIDYYIPNYGYVVLVDSNFKDLSTRNTSILDCPRENTYKINSQFLQCVQEETIDYKSKTFENFIKAMDSNIYDQSFINDGGCRPPPEVIFLLDQIKSYANSDNNKFIGEYIYKFMSRFVNNRTGTYLKDTEVANIRRDEQKNFQKGQIVVFEDGYSSYKFVILIGTTQGNANILTKNDPSNSDVVEITVPISSLYGYSRMEPILQNFRPNESNLNEDDLLETYIMNFEK